MDKLTKLSLQHEEVFENLSFFKKAIGISDKGDKVNYLKKLGKFFKDYIIAHFIFEENKILPLVLKEGKAESKNIVRLLQHDHINILTYVDRFNALIVSLGSNPDKNKISKAVDLSKEIIRVTLEHARMEDKDFFPLIKGIFKK